MEQNEFLSAVLIVSQDPARLAAFYRDVVGIPLKDEAHGQSLPHYGCTLGDLHFAIHPVETFPDRRNGVGAVKQALNVFDIEALVKRLEEKGVKGALSTRRHRIFHQHRDQRPRRQLHRVHADVRRLVQAPGTTPPVRSRRSHALEVLALQRSESAIRTRRSRFSTLQANAF